MKQIFLILFLFLIGILGYFYLAERSADFPGFKQIQDVLPDDFVSEEAELEDITWRVTAIGSVAIEDAGITANFSSGTLAGNDGCNQYSTTYAVDAQTLKIDEQIASTLMACPEPTMVLANLYVQALGTVTNFSQEGDTLLLRNSDANAVITLQKQTRELSDTIWKVTGYNDGKGKITPPLDQTELTFSFDEQSQFQASACNAMSGTYTLGSDGAVTISDLTSTEMACPTPEGAMQQESIYAMSLSEVGKYERNQSILVLRDIEGNIQITAEIIIPL